MASREKKTGKKRDESAKSEIANRIKTQPFIYIGTIIILIIVVIAFVFVPIMTPSGTFGGELIFGYYNRVPIQFVPNNFFHQQYERLIRFHQPSSDSPSYIMDMAQIWREAFELTVVQTGVLDEMRVAGFVAPENWVDREVAGLSIFQENGRFSSARYRALDNSTRLSIWRRTQEDIAFNMYISDLTSLRVSSDEGAFISSMASPKRSFDLAIFPLTDFPDSEVVSFLQNNPDHFRTVHLSRITITSSEREARQILEMVRSGVTTFEEAAVNHSQDWASDRGGDLGPMMAFQLQLELIEEPAWAQLINLGRGELSELITLPEGWAFFRAEEASIPADLNNPLHSQAIREFMVENSRGHIEDWHIERVEGFIDVVNERGFDRAVTEYGVTRSSLGPISLNYGDSLFFSTIRTAGVRELVNAGANQFFWTAAFFTPLRTPSRPLVIDNNVIVFYPLEEIDADEDEKASIESYYVYRALDSTSHGYRSYFLNNRKMDDRFDETFWSLWW